MEGMCRQRGKGKGRERHSRRKGGGLKPLEEVGEVAKEKGERVKGDGVA